MAASSASVSFPSFKLKYLLIFTCLIGIVSAHLSTKFYDKTCPKAVKTITKAVDEAVSTEPRMVLLDDTENFTGEKNSFPNANSLRGFEVIDNIKSTLEKLCPATVSCADILAVAASESVGALGGQRWNVPLGRRDSITASLSESNSDLPAPFLDLNGLITAFAKKNFTTQEMVILSGAHTIGQARCTFFRGRIYNESNIDSSYAAAMQAACPFEGGDGNLSPFDTKTSATFDNAYYQNLVNLKGLLHSDQQLFVNGSGITDSQGCDASVLLDDTPNFTGEKNSFPNANSLRGFEVIDNIKSQLEELCPGVVSCADILAVAASEAVGILGGQRWNVPLGRRDSTSASLSEANSDIPAPFLDLNGLISTFSNKGFTVQEMVTLSGAHTIGLVRCRFFRDRIYNETNIDPSFSAAMKEECPFDDGDDNLSPFDSKTPMYFDNAYYRNLIESKGLVHSDQQLFVDGSGLTKRQVIAYSKNFGRFKHDFANAMFKMSQLSPLTGSDGQIRNNCHFINPTTDE
ncbi:hypothetical protein Lal_00047347 [Lupinus albus]|nr:hypothetical protein Lal_00047347 [Lupinus albus]